MRPSVPFLFTVIQPASALVRSERRESTLPLMVDAKAGQPGYGLALCQLLQTDGALATVFTEHIRCTHTHTHTQD